MEGMEIIIQPINREISCESDGCNVDIGCIDIDVCVPDC